MRCAGKEAHLILNGLLIHCPLRLQGDLQLDVAHCTIAPHGIEVSHAMPNTPTLQLTGIIGPLRSQRGRGMLRASSMLSWLFSYRNAIRNAINLSSMAIR